MGTRFALLLLVVPAAAAQDPRSEAVVRAAVEAAGGAGPLNRFPAGRLTAKGTLAAGGADVPVAVEQVFHLPDRMRTVVRSRPKGQKLEVVQVVNGAKTRQTVNGGPVPATDATLKEMQVGLLLLEAGQLTPLLDEKKFALKPDRAAKGPDQAGVLVQVKGFPDLRLGFDRKTGHLVRVSRRALDPDTGKDADFETVLADHKAFGELVRPTRATLYRDGQKFLELVTESFTPLEKADPKEFATED